MDFSYDQNFIIYLASLVPSISSVLGSLLIIGIYLKYPEFRQFPYVLVLLLSISDLFLSLGIPYTGFLFPGFLDSRLCYAQAILLSFSGMYSILQTSTITYTIYLIVAKVSPKAERSGRTLYILAFLLSCVATVVPLIEGVYGHSGGWCWIRMDAEYFEWYSIGIFLGPAFLCLFGNTVLIIFLIRYVIVDQSISKAQNKRMLVKFVFYPIVLGLSIGPCFGSRVYEVLTKSYNFELSLVSRIAWSFNGLLNSIVYGVNTALKNRLKHICCPNKAVKEASLLDEVHF